MRNGHDMRRGLAACGKTRNALARTRVAGLVPAFLALAAVGCGGSLDGWDLDVLGNGTSPPAGETTGATCGSDARPLVDVLWVVDDSTSMCEEKRASAEGFARFVAGLGNADVRVAVTTTNLVSGGGRFLTASAPEAGGCPVRRPFPAEYDYHCACMACAGWDAALFAQLRDDQQPLPPVPEDEGGVERYVRCLAEGCLDDPIADRWVLEERLSPDQVYNRNGSTNTVCRFQCRDEMDGAGAGDDRCAAAFPATGATCEPAPGDVGAAQCVLPLDTDGCPAELPPVLPSFDAEGVPTRGLDAFRCLASPAPAPGGDLEQGFRAAWEALRPDGPNAAQVCEPRDPALADEALSAPERRARCARAFLRPGAALVVVFVSDEDDCSLSDGKTLAPEDHSLCALLGDADDEPLIAPTAGSDARPLWSVAETVARLRSVAPEPDLLHVVAVVGDVLGARSEGDRNLRLGDYFRSLTEPGVGLPANTAICTSPRGRANYGTRYLQLAHGELGRQGHAINLCANDAFGDALGAAGAAILAALPCRE